MLWCPVGCSRRHSWSSWCGQSLFLPLCTCKWIDYLGRSTYKWIQQFKNALFHCSWSFIEAKLKTVIANSSSRAELSSFYYLCPFKQSWALALEFSLTRPSVFFNSGNSTASWIATAQRLFNSYNKLPCARPHWASLNSKSSKTEEISLSSC